MKLKKFDVADFLDSDEALVEYLNAALAENDPNWLRQGARQRSTRQRDVLYFRCQWGRGGNLFTGHSRTKATPGLIPCSKSWKP